MPLEPYPAKSGGRLQQGCRVLREGGPLDLPWGACAPRSAASSHETASSSVAVFVRVLVNVDVIRPGSGPWGRPPGLVGMWAAGVVVSAAVSAVVVVVVVVSAAVPGGS